MVRLFELAARRRLPLAYLISAIGAVPAVIAACYSTGNGTPPPPAIFYFPVGMTVSHGGNVLYVVNSDFDLQYNGGTIQSYDLQGIRQDAAASASGYSLSPELPFPEAGGLPQFLDGATKAPPGTNLCAEGDVIFLSDGGFVSSCAPFINASFYERDSVTIGAFATDLQISPWGNRLYSPVRGDASLTWLTITPDTTALTPTNNHLCPVGAVTPDCYPAFSLQCGQTNNGGRCDATHHAGVNPYEPGNTRNLTMPGEPFAMAQSADGTAIVLTHQSEGDTSLFLTGLTADGGGASPSTPSMQFVVDAGLPTGGDGIANVPHDPHAYGCTDASVSTGECVAFPQPAFLETNNTAAELNLIRYYSDDGTQVVVDAGAPDANLPVGSTLQRPFITVERSIIFTSLSGGTDSRGIAFDTSARLACEHLYPFPDPRNESCAQLPARTFFANRTPATLVIGNTGGPSQTDGKNTYDADALSVVSTTDVSPGPSRVYLAPIVDADGDYALRVFVVCFDHNSIDVINPETNLREASIAVGGGPFAMAFDPYDPLDVALNRQVQSGTYNFDPGDGSGTVPIPLPRYRYAYVASFTNSYVQVIDLDDSEKNKSTFESVVYTLGTPSIPKGNQ